MDESGLNLTESTGGGGVHFSPGPQPPRRGQGGPEGGGGGGGSKFYRVLGAFLKSLFRSEHFEYTQVWGGRIQFTMPESGG